jgi:precorrin-6x reductase
MKSLGKLYLVSVGPGIAELIPPKAESALRASDAVVGYELYLKWIAPWIEGRRIYSLPLTKERERAARAIDLARSGSVTSMVSSGDIGVYAMASLVLEEMREEDEFDLEIIPGISAANSCASLLGSPLSHDFATLSLSDLLCPWEWIEHRARQLAKADLVTALYNVQSRKRQDGVYRILRVMLEHKSPRTFCGVVKNAYRDGQEHFVCTLSELLDRQFDMLTTIFVGNRFTRRKREFIYTPRGYNSWEIPCEQESRPAAVVCPSVWVFSGTSDGNALAAEIANSGHEMIVSVASEYGRELLAQNFPGLVVRAGKIGVEARRRELQESQAIAIVDATHPFATEISTQLMGIAGELDIPYVRYDREKTERRPEAVYCKDMEVAAAHAVEKGTRIFLATGTKDLQTFLKHRLAAEREWYVRISPDPASLECALRLGISRAHLCAMQGPFSRELNEALWRSWNIDCVVTKDSGEAGGFHGKADAAEATGATLIVVERPFMTYPVVASNFESVIQYLNRCLYNRPVAV